MASKKKTTTTVQSTTEPTNNMTISELLKVVTEQSELLDSEINKLQTNVAAVVIPYNKEVNEPEIPTNTQMGKDLSQLLFRLRIATKRLKHINTNINI